MARADDGGADSLGKTPISEVMTRRVVCVRSDMPVEEVAALFIARKLGGAPVVDERGDLTGVITRRDLMRFGWDGDSDDALDDDPDDGGWTAGDRLAELPFVDVGVTVAEIMTPFAFALASDVSIAHAAALMAYEGIHRVVVVSPNGAIVGLLAGRDILRWLAHHNGYVIPEPERRRDPAVEIAGAGATVPVTGVPALRLVRPRLVMIIDDDADVREDYAELLREEGYEVVTAANGREALDRLASNAPSLILLDLVMPVMDGWSFHDRLAGDPQLGKIPVVLLSGSTYVVEEAARMSVDDFLLKPVPVRELLGTVEQYCS